MAKHRKSLRKQGHGTRNAIIVIALFAAAIGSIAYLLAVGTGGSSVMLRAGQEAPEFELASVVNGSTFNLANYANKSDVLLFFNEGLSCSPCLQQMVDIDKAYSTFRQMGLTVVSITTDSPSSLGTWARNNGISNMMILSDSSLKVDTTYTTMGAGTGSMHEGMAPGHTFILVGKDGKILWREDYGTSTMYVPMDQLTADVKSALG
ncbi:MAG: redoxin domain-containing protein [Nitrososphaerota archaeon]|nr:redoxin domain-containing protein [Nitrososphaerota archaeon]MDG7023744.1 redoxin domain-containing protein [Nitrososphaerota archaeon]